MPTSVMLCWEQVPVAHCATTKLRNQPQKLSGLLAHKPMKPLASLSSVSNGSVVFVGRKYNLPKLLVVERQPTKEGVYLRYLGGQLR